MCVRTLTLQHTATHCNALQRTATHCNTLQHWRTYDIYAICELHHTATHIVCVCACARVLCVCACCACPLYVCVLCAICVTLQHISCACVHVCVCTFSLCVCVLCVWEYVRVCARVSCASTVHSTTATHCNTLQHTAAHCNTEWRVTCAWHACVHQLYTSMYKTQRCQCVAVCFAVVAVRRKSHTRHTLFSFVVCCSVWQRVAVCYSVLQCVAACCSVLQCVAVCCSDTHVTHTSYIIRCCSVL